MNFNHHDDAVWLRRIQHTAILSLLGCIAAVAQPPASLVIINSASGATVVAPGSIASAFGRQVGASTAQATSLPLPTVLGGVSVNVTDSGNTAGMEQLFYVSPNQINFVLGDITKTGTATAKILGGTNSPMSTTVQVAKVAPGLFTANGAGVGVAAAIAIRRDIATQTDNPVPVYQCDANGCSSVGIDVGPDAQTFSGAFWNRHPRPKLASECDGDHRRRECRCALCGSARAVPRSRSGEPLAPTNIARAR